MEAIHNILFNMYLLYVLILGVWAAVMAARSQSISGNFWGAMAVSIGLAALITSLGLLMALQGLRLASDRMTVYFLYMAWLVVIMPGLYSMLRGRDDSSAALAFSLLAFFNFAVGISMLQRGLITDWVPV